MNKCIVVVDIGNTHIVMGIYINETLHSAWRFSSDRQKTADEYYSIIKSLADEAGILLKEARQIALSSVVPSLTRVFTHLFTRYFTCPFVVVSGYLEIGLHYSVPDPGFIGADLIVNAFSAINKYERNCIVCDLGTATTIQLVSVNGDFLGTAIAPGMVTASDNLLEKAAQLSNIQLEKPEKLLGLNTRDALLSGIIQGHAYMIDGFIKDLKEQYSNLAPLYAVATGGISSLVGSCCHQIDVIDRTLTLDGLYNIACLAIGKKHA